MPCFDDEERVLLAIDATLPQGAKHFRDGHRNNFGTEGLEDRFHDRIRNHPNPEPGYVRRLEDRAPGIGEVTKTAVGKAQEYSAAAVDLRPELLADRPFEHLGGMRGIAEQVGHIEDAQRRYHGRDAGGGNDCKIEGAQSQGFPDILLATQCAATLPADGEAPRACHCARGPVELFP